MSTPLSPHWEWGQGDLGREGEGERVRRGQVRVPFHPAGPARAILHGVFPIQLQ